jgi:hypothetical protein
VPELLQPRRKYIQQLERQSSLELDVLQANRSRWVGVHYSISNDALRYLEKHLPGAGGRASTAISFGVIVEIRASTYSHGSIGKKAGL